MAVSRQDSLCFHSLLKQVLGNALRMATRAVEALLALSPLRKEQRDLWELSGNRGGCGRRTEKLCRIVSNFFFLIIRVCLVLVLAFLSMDTDLCHWRPSLSSI